MIRVILCVFALLILGRAKPVHAEVLTCAVFKTRLSEAMGSVGAASAAPHAFILSHDGGALGQRFVWRDAGGLSGRLTCGQNDAFADFYVAVESNVWPVSAHLSILSRFKDLGAASVCALLAATPRACMTLLATMTQEGFDQYKDDLAQKDDRPQGLRDYDLSDGLEAVFYLMPTRMSWAIGPGVSAPMQSQRAVLAPHDHDDGDEDDD